MNVVDHKCINCNSILNYNEKKKLWYCEYCKKSYTLKDLEENIKKFDEVKIDKLEEYECPNCGAQVLTSSTTSSTVCLYCGNSVIIKKRIIDDYHPDFIIPFQNTEEETIDSFFKNTELLKLCPKDYNNKNNVIRIERLYVPYWLISCEVMASVKGIVFQESDNHQTNMHYRRLGSMKLNNIPIKAKSNIPEKLLRGIEPFSFENAVKFEYPYLAGIWAERYDVTKDDIEKSEIKEVIENSIINKIMRTVTLFPDQYPPMEKSIYKSKYNFNYILLPVWFMVIKYHNKEYYYCINDQTGKVEGEFPVNEAKLNRNIAVTAALIMILSIVLSIIIGNSLFVLLGVVIMLTYMYIYRDKVNRKYRNIEKEIDINDYINKAELKILDSNDVYD